MNEKEFGGYLPLEFEKHSEYFSLPEQHIRRYNCGRTAIFAAAAQKRFQKIYIPYFICDTVREALKEQGIAVERYSVNEGLRPVGLDALPEGSAVLLVNYFGLLDDVIHSLQASFRTVLIDNTQAFYCPPVLREGVCNVYSCRKFIGVPDGGYLIEQNSTAPRLEAENSWPYYAFLCKAHELGTNAAYAGNLENEQRFATSRHGMSRLTRLVLQSAPYQMIKDARQENYIHMERRLGTQNRLKVSLGSGVPYLYPYWAEEKTGPHIRAELLKRHIYIPTLWKECLETCAPDTLEYQWAQDLICLPIDQRYQKTDIDTIIDILLEIQGGQR